MHNGTASLPYPCATGKIDDVSLPLDPYVLGLLIGDVRQVDIPDSGIVKLTEKLSESPELAKVIHHIDFDSIDDVVRSGACKLIVEHLF